MYSLALTAYATQGDVDGWLNECDIYFGSINFPTIGTISLR